MQFFISIRIYWNAELWCIELFVLIKSAETKIVTVVKKHNIT